MNRILTGILCLAFLNANAQEGIIDSIKASSFTGVHQAGEMGEILYVPYFTTNKSKKNFIINQLSGESFLTENTIRLELPDSYQLKNSAFNGSSYLLYFYDAAKSEDVLITTSFDGNIAGKLSFKSNGGQLVPLGGSSPEGFTLVDIDKKGNYKVSFYDLNLKPKWEKSYKPSSGSWEVVDVKSNIEKVLIIRKETTGDKYVFTTHAIQPENGETISENKISTDKIVAYPHFYTTHEGLGISGGTFYNNATYSEQNPDGIYIATMGPDANIEQVVSVPYSQVIEDLKNSVGSELNKSNTKIVFNSGTFSHEIQRYIMVGQLYTIQKDNNKGGTVTLKDLVVVSFDFEQRYLEAHAINIKQHDIALSGDLSKTNSTDIAIWLSNSSITNFKYFAGFSANAIAYTDLDNGMDKIFYRTPIAEADTNKPINFEIVQMTQKPQSSFAYTPFNKAIHTYSVLSNPMDMEKISTYEYKAPMLFLRKTPGPSMEEFRVEIAPMEPHDEGEEHGEEEHEAEEE